MGDADEDHALGGREPGAPAVAHLVLTLAALEWHQRAAVLLCEALDVGEEAIAHRGEQRRRRDRVASMVFEEVPELSRGLQRRHLAVDVDAIDTGNRQADVVLDNGVDVAFHVVLLG